MRPMAPQYYLLFSLLRVRHGSFLLLGLVHKTWLDIKANCSQGSFLLRLCIRAEYKGTQKQSEYMHLLTEEIFKLSTRYVHSWPISQDHECDIHISRCGPTQVESAAPPQATRLEPSPPLSTRPSERHPAHYSMLTHTFQDAKPDFHSRPSLQGYQSPRQWS